MALTDRNFFGSCVGSSVVGYVARGVGSGKCLTQNHGLDGRAAKFIPNTGKYLWTGRYGGWSSYAAICNLQLL
jgi:hypothetical protein